MNLDHRYSIISNDKHAFIEMKEEFIQVVMIAKEAHSLGSLSISESAHSNVFLPLPIVLTACIYDSIPNQSLKIP